MRAAGTAISFCTPRRRPPPRVGRPVSHGRTRRERRQAPPYALPSARCSTRHRHPPQRGGEERGGIRRDWPSEVGRILWPVADLAERREVSGRESGGGSATAAGEERAAGGGRRRDPGRAGR
ncbi:hypothetical protein BS78_09G026500 [Paspalum vaginatum]|nr:hypothetical protein BS78_09G026500 [Paspalum vaginatum]